MNDIQIFGLPPSDTGAFIRYSILQSDKRSEGEADIAIMFHASYAIAKIKQLFLGRLESIKVDEMNWSYPSVSKEQFCIVTDLTRIDLEHILAYFMLKENKVLLEVDSHLTNADLFALASFAMATSLRYQIRTSFYEDYCKRDFVNATSRTVNIATVKASKESLIDLEFVTIPILHGLLQFKSKDLDLLDRHYPFLGLKTRQPLSTNGNLELNIKYA